MGDVCLSHWTSGADEQLAQDLEVAWALDDDVSRLMQGPHSLTTSSAISSSSCKLT